MICSNCGTENVAGQHFCDECGSVLTSPCPNCGESNRPSAKFCGNCGTTLAGAAVQSTAPVFASPPVESPTGERRFVSVLFVDLVGFTPFAEERDAEQVRETLDRYFALARLTVERHGGTIEKFIGDAVMAVWGTPTAHEDDAERAVRSGLELVDQVRGLAPGTEARAGIVTGDAAVAVGAQGQGMVAGDIVNTASRLQSVAPAGSVLVGETTMKAAQAAIAFESAGEHVLKGKTAPVTAYRALRVVANRGGQNRSESLEAPFVGRDEELRLLKDLVHATARDSRVRLVSISGPAGIGKSRLTWEFEKYIDGVVETIYWHRGRSPAYGEGITFWALGEMVRRRAQLAETDDETTTRHRIAETVEQWLEDADERRWVEPALLALLGVEPAPPGGRDALFSAWRIFFERIAEHGTTVMVFEDLQWADSGLLDFIEHLLEWSKNQPLLVVALTRPELYEKRPGWGSGHRLMTAMPLEPLPGTAMRELLGGLVPGLPEQAVEAILRRADGIPLYAVETIRMLVSEGRLEALDGTYRPVGELRDLAVPETLRSLIASRLDALDATDRSLVQDGAVLGQRFSMAALASISGMPEAEIEPRLRTLVRRELLDLEVDPRSPERGQYGFVQSLIREVAYGTLARRERRTRHVAAARYFEALGDDELAGALATHYLDALEASSEGAEADAVAVQARLALRGAAERAAALGAHDQAVGYLDQALAIATDAADRAVMLQMAAVSANSLSRHDAAESYARQAIEIQSAADAATAARTSALLGRVLIDSGRLPDAIAVMEAALVGHEEADETSSTLYAILSRAYMRSNQPSRSIDAADRALSYAERHNLEEVVAEALVNKASSLNMLARRREAVALHATAIKLAEAGGWLELELRARNNLSVGLIGDEPRRALEIVHAGIDLARRVGQRGILNWQLGTAAMYMMAIGEDWDAALAGLEETLSTAPPGYDRARASAIRAVYRAMRGEDLGDLDSERVADAGALADLQVAGTIAYARAEQALFAGRYDNAYSLAVSGASNWPDFGGVIMPAAIRAALWSGDLSKVSTGIEQLEEGIGGAPWDEALRSWTSAGVAMLEGRASDAATGFRAGIAGMRDIGLRLYEAQQILDAVRLLKADPEVRSWAPTARATFERLRAAPYLRLLDEAIAASASKPAEPAPDAARTPSTV